MYCWRYQTQTHCILFHPLSNICSKTDFFWRAIERIGYKTQVLLCSRVFLIFHTFNDILKVSCRGNMRGIVQDIERSEKALLSPLKNSAFIHLLGKTAMMHIKPVYTQALYMGKKLCVFFWKHTKICWKIYI